MGYWAEGEVGRDRVDWEMESEGCGDDDGDSRRARGEVFLILMSILMLK